MKNIWSWIILMFCTIQLSYAQQTITGRVLESESKTPLMGVNIYIPTLQMGTISDQRGDFKLVINGQVDSIEFSYIGFKKLTLPVRTDMKLFVEMKVMDNLLNEIIVSANREPSLRSETPVSISRISQTVINNTKPTALYEVINKTSGVMMVNLNNEQHSMSIRQPMTTSGYYLYMEDGIGIRPMGIFNHNALIEINQNSVQSIEIIKGPVSSIYGPEAVGGTINFLTHKPTAMPTFKLGFQNNQHGHNKLQFSGSGIYDQLGIYVGGFTSKQKKSWMTNSDYEKHIINSRLEYSLSDATKLTGTFVYGKYYSDTGGSVDSLAFFSRKYVSLTDFTYRKVEASRSRIAIEHDWNETSRSMVTGYHRMNKHGQNPSYGIRWSSVVSGTNDPNTAKGEINSNDFTSLGINFQHIENFSLFNSKLISGGLYDVSPNDYLAYRIDLLAILRPGGKSVERYEVISERPDVVLTNYSAKIYNSALYVQYDIKPTDRWLLSFGGRWDQMSFDYHNKVDQSSGDKVYSQFTGKIGTTYNFENDMGMYSNISKGFSPPALTAIFRKKPNTNPVEFYLNLEPAVFMNYEIGGWMSLLNHQLYVDISLYQLDGKNELLNIRQQDNSFDYQSAGKTLHRGVEFGINYHVNEQVQLRLNGSAAIHKFEDFEISNKTTDQVKKLDGYEMPSAPHFMSNMEINYQPDFISGLKTSLEWQFVSGWYENQINTVKNSGYHVFNLRTGYEFVGIQTYFHILNLTDELYAVNSTRGNNLTDRTTYTPAAPRTFVLGIEYKFSL